MLRSIYLGIFLIILLISPTTFSASPKTSALDEAISAMQELDPEISDIHALEKIITSMAIYFDMKDAGILSEWRSARKICIKGIEEEKLFKCATLSILFQNAYGNFFSSQNNVTTNPDKFDNAHFTGAIVLLEHYYKKMKPSLRDSIPILAQIVMAKEKGWSGMHYVESDHGSGNICSPKGLANHFSGTPGGGVTDPTPGGGTDSFSGGGFNPMGGPEAAAFNQATMNADIVACPLNFSAMGGGVGGDGGGETTDGDDDPHQQLNPSPTPTPESPDKDESGPPDTPSTDLGDLSGPSPLDGANNSLNLKKIFNDIRKQKFDGGSVEAGKVGGKYAPSGVGINFKISFSPRPNGPDFYSACTGSGALSYIASCSASSGNDNNFCGNGNNSPVSMPDPNYPDGDDCGGGGPGYFMDNKTPIVNWGPGGPPSSGENGGTPSDPCEPDPVSGLPKNPQACCAKDPSTPGCGPNPVDTDLVTFPHL